MGSHPQQLFGEPMTILPVSLFNFAQSKVSQDKASIMRLENNQSFLICSAFCERLAEIWPLLQPYKPRLEVCSTSQARYGHIFTVGLWTYIQQLCAHLSSEWMMEHWGKGAQIDIEGVMEGHKLAYLRALVGDAPDFKLLPATCDGW